MIQPYFPNVAKVQVDINVCSTFLDLSFNVLMMAIGTHWVFGTTVCFLFLSLARELH